MSLPTISIVTPCYQSGAYLEATIQSVLNQQYPHLEYIVIDGGSIDETLSIIKKYESQLSYWVSEPDEGQTDAINKGFAKSTGQIMGWLNADDLLMPDALWTIAHHFESYPDTSVVTGLRKIIRANGQWVRNELFWTPDTPVIQRGAFIAQETTYWRRSVWETIGTLDDSFYFAMDYEYWQRILANGYHFDLIPEYLGKFRVHQEAKSSKDTDRRAEDLARVYQHYGIAQNETEALAQLTDILGNNWRHKQRMLIEFGHRELSHDAKAYLRYFDLLNTPIIGTALVEAHRLYNRLRGRPVY